jgi:hypothetical protein
LDFLPLHIPEAWELFFDNIAGEIPREFWEQSYAAQSGKSGDDQHATGLEMSATSVLLI